MKNRPGISWGPDLPINLMDDPLFCVVLGTGKILDDFEKYRPVIMK